MQGGKLVFHEPWSRYEAQARLPCTKGVNVSAILALSPATGQGRSAADALLSNSSELRLCTSIRASAAGAQTQSGAVAEPPVGGFCIAEG